MFNQRTPPRSCIIVFAVLLCVFALLYSVRSSLSSYNNTTKDQPVFASNLVPVADEKTFSLHRVSSGFPDFNWKECVQFQCIMNHLNRSRSLIHKVKYDDDNGALTNCSIILLDMLSNTHETLQKFGIHDYLVFGSLLGSFNIQSIFGWTHDVDVAVNSTAFIMLASRQLPVHEELYRNYGLLMFRGGEKLIRVCATERYFDLKQWNHMMKLRRKVDQILPARKQMEYFQNNVYLDIYEEYQVEDGLVKVNPGTHAFRKSDIYELVNCPIDNLIFKCPKDSASILRKHYGANKFNRVLENHLNYN